MNWKKPNYYTLDVVFFALAIQIFQNLIIYFCVRFQNLEKKNVGFMLSYQIFERLQYILYFKSLKFKIDVKKSFKYNWLI
jgi:hypothetical protein